MIGDWSKSVGYCQYHTGDTSLAARASSKMRAWQFANVSAKGDVQPGGHLMQTQNKKGGAKGKQKILQTAHNEPFIEEVYDKNSVVALGRCATVPLHAPPKTTVAP